MQKQPYLLVSAIDQLLISAAGFGSFCPLFTYIWCSSKRVRTLEESKKLEIVIEENGQLRYVDKQGNTQSTYDILLVSITTDEGVLEPFGVAEVLLQVHY